MVPFKLQLKNFLSYGPDIQTVDFAEHQLICFSGKNGHGKSALLDALTWVLWGQARKKIGNAKVDDSILRLGQTQMMVSLDFECGGNIYRVRREYARTYGKPHSALDFAILNADGSALSLTDKTTRLTQAKIEQTIRIDFDSFVNSAFLRQGQSNEFSQKSPKDRKKILASILGLNRYDDIHVLASEKARNHLTEKKQLLLFQEQREKELATQHTIQEQYLHTKASLEQLATKEATLKEGHTLLETALIEHNHAKASYTSAQAQQHALQQQEQQAISKFRTLVKTWRSTEQMLHKAPNRSALEQKKHVLIAHIAQQQSTLNAQLDAKKQLLEKKEALFALEKQLDHTARIALQEQQTKLDMVQVQRQQYEKTMLEAKHAVAQKNEQQKTIATTQHLLQQQIGFDITPDNIKKFQAQFEKRKAFFHSMVSQGKWTQQELLNVAHKQELSQDEHNPSCPLCEQNLSLARRRFLKNVLTEQEHFLRYRVQKIERFVKAVKQLLVAQHATLALLQQFQEQAQKQEALAIEYATGMQQILTHTKAMSQLNTEHAQVVKHMETVRATCTAERTTNAEYKALVASIEQLNTTILDTNAINTEYERHRGELTIIEKQLEQVALSQQEASKQQDRAAHIQEINLSIKKLRNELRTVQAQAPTSETIQTQAHKIQEQRATLDQQHTVIRQQKEALLQQQGSLENQQKQLATVAQEHEQQKKAIVALEKTIDNHMAIAVATGKDGIQALLIEEAIPEIEQEANNLLSKLTDNQAQIFIEPLRDLKKGGTKETLDIRISDQMGIRPYEMFSGGEAFRIDFALRIAISKLLARRAGTSLQTLIIDEGFGSQDDEGLSHIMDALHKIQDDFLKIIIVSHLPAMKEQFPVHFFIEKRNNCSTVTVIEQG